MENENNSGWRAVGTILAQVILGAVCAAGGWIGCGMYDAHAKKNAGAVQAPPAAAPTVSVAEVRELPYNLPERYVAHAEALQEVDLLPQVDGYVKEIKFKEGDIVAAGQELYILDDERYQAIVGQRKADLAAAQAEKTAPTATSSACKRPMRAASRSSSATTPRRRRSPRRRR